MHRTTFPADAGGRSSRPVVRRRIRRSVAALGVAGVMAAAAALTAPAAQAATASITDASFTWGLSGTATAGAYYGGCNFLSAGLAGDTGSSSVWTTSKPSPGYLGSSGDVEVLKPNASGVYAQQTWANKCTGPDGSTALSTSTSSGAVVKFSNGTGSVDPEAGTASISWEGSFTSAFYGGMTYWSATDPTLTVAADGTGTLTASLSGYAASMTDTSVWDAISARQVTMATFTDVEVTSTGISITPDYLGVTNGESDQVTTGTSAGSFPSSFIDFQSETGQLSYWYSSGLNDALKVADDITVAYSAADGASGDTEETGDTGDTDDSDSGDGTSTGGAVLGVDPVSDLADGDTITVTGSGYDTETVSQYTGAADVYVALGWINSAGWKPSESYASTNRVYATVYDATTSADNQAKGGQYQVLNPDGTFSVTFEVDTDTIESVKTDAVDTLAVFTLGGGGVVNAANEASVEVALADDTDTDTGDDGSDTGTGSDSQTITATIPSTDDGDDGDGSVPAGSFTWTIDGTSRAVTMSTAVNEGTYFEASGDLIPVTVTDTRENGPTWSVSGQVGDFGTDLSGKYLGWTPAVSTEGAGAVAGAAVSTGLETGDGLTVASTLASADSGHETGSASVGADLLLQAPTTTVAGTYTATLTLTALS